MDGVARGPILQFVCRLAEIFQDLAVEVLDPARGTQGTNKPRNRVDDPTQAGLTLLERDLIALSLHRNRRQLCYLLHDFFILLTSAARPRSIEFARGPC